MRSNELTAALLNNSVLAKLAPHALAVVAVCGCLAVADAAPIYIDLGPAGTATAGNWNNVTNPETGGDDLGALTNLIDADGNLTGIGHEFAEKTPAVGGAAAVNVNFVSGSGDAAALPATAVQDLIYASEAGANVHLTFRLTNLDPNTPYTIQTYSALNPQRDNTVVTVEGAGGPQTQSISPTGNTSFLTFANIYPTAQNAITYTLAEDSSLPDPGASYMNAVIITPGVPEPSSLAMLMLGLGIFGKRRRL